MHRRLLSSGRLLAAILLTAPGTVIGVQHLGTPAGADEEPISEQTVPADEVARAVDVRARFGLKSDVAHVTNVAAQTDHPDLSYLGVPLTLTEVSELQRRDRVMDTFSRLESALMTLMPDKYGGVWIDHEGGGDAIIASTSPNTIPIATVRSILPSGSKFRLIETAVPLRRLEDLAKRTLADFQMWTSKGLTINQFGTALMDNTFGIVLAEGSPEGHVQQIIDAYGAAGLSVKIGPNHVPAAHAPPVSRGATSGPFYGGQIVGTPQGDCTGTLSATSNTRGRTWGITAGHCTNLGNVYQGGNNVGGAWLGYGIGADNGFHVGTTSNCDCTTFGFNNQGLPAGKATNTVITNGGHLFTYGNWASQAGNYPVTRRICVSGWVSGQVNCDQIRENNRAVNLTRAGKTQLITNELLMFCSGQGGDSGAPAGDGLTWMGILSSVSAGAPMNVCGNAAHTTAVSRVQFLPQVAHATPNLPAQ